jgi:hypothetical protein
MKGQETQKFTLIGSLTWSLDDPDRKFALDDAIQKDAMSGTKAAVVFQQSPSSKSLLDGKGDTGKWIEQLSPQLLRIGSSARWS